MAIFSKHTIKYVLQINKSYYMCQHDNGKTFHELKASEISDAYRHTPWFDKIAHIARMLKLPW